MKMNFMKRAILVPASIWALYVFSDEAAILGL